MAFETRATILHKALNRLVLGITLLLSGMGISSCGGEGLTSEYTVGGLVTGLAGSGLALRLNGGEELTIYGNGPFLFQTNIWNGSSYLVEVLTQPTNPNQTCLVTNGKGTSTRDITNVEVVCDFLEYQLGGTVSGHTDTLVLQNNGKDDLDVLITDTTFVFSTTQKTFDKYLQHGDDYLVSVLTPPTDQTCTVSRGSGTALADVTDVAVVCSSEGFLVGGSVTGLQGMLYLQNNYEVLAVPQNGSFQFTQPVAAGGIYDVRVYRQPVEQTCSVSSGNGTALADVATVAVICRTRFNTN